MFVTASFRGLGEEMAAACAGIGLSVCQCDTRCVSVFRTKNKISVETTPDTETSCCTVTRRTEIHLIQALCHAPRQSTLQNYPSEA